MSIKRPQLRKWARPQGILLESEWARLGDFLDLYNNVLQQYAQDPEAPTPIEITMCRVITSDIWRYDRETNDAAALMKEVVSKKSFSEARRNAFRDADERTRLRNLHVSSIRKSEELLDILMSSAAGVTKPQKSKVIKLRNVK